MIRFHKYKKAQKEYKTPKSTKKYKNTTNLKVINLKFIDIKFINLKFIGIRFIKLKKHLSGKNVNVFIKLITSFNITFELKGKTKRIF